MNEMEDLLAQLKAEYNQSESKSSSAKPIPEKDKQLKPEKTQPLDNLLAQVKTEFESGKVESKNISRQEDNSFKQSSVNTSSSHNSLIEEVQAEYQAQAKEEEKRKQQEILAQQKQQEEKAKRKQEALRKKAQEWLKQLKPNSDEALWFEEFAYSYESRVEAAIDYLEAIRESRMLG
jgi:hypothetical protein